MGPDYPEDLLAREPAPRYEGKARLPSGTSARIHPWAGSIHVSHLRKPEAQPLVWAVDTRHAPMFWFPRDCPRGCIWPVSATTPEDRERFFGQSAANRVHVIEAGWLKRIHFAAQHQPGDVPVADPDCPGVIAPGRGGLGSGWGGGLVHGGSACAASVRCPS